MGPAARKPARERDSDVVLLLKEQAHLQRGILLQLQRMNDRNERMDATQPNRKRSPGATDVQLGAELLPAIKLAVKAASFSTAELVAELPLCPDLKRVIERAFGKTGTKGLSAEKKIGHALRRFADRGVVADGLQVRREKSPGGAPWWRLVRVSEGFENQEPIEAVRALPSNRVK